MLLIDFKLRQIELKNEGWVSHSSNRILRIALSRLFPLFPLLCNKPAIRFGNARHVSRNTSCDKHSTPVQQLEPFSMAYR